MKLKRALLICGLLVLTVGCYVFMNRNYDPLARYPYGDQKTREKMIEVLDEREIKYIIDYSIEPSEFAQFLDGYRFNAYRINEYQKAKIYLYSLTNSQVVNIVNVILDDHDDLENYLNEFMFLSYDEIMYRLNTK
ncbi:MAG: hypothetical protein Q4B60_02645 [Erysipelotrichaceae bacterium]|nr:hypothetical protein [Erysipelotrichaceae bacterium]